MGDVLAILLHAACIGVIGFIAGHRFHRICMLEKAHAPNEMAEKYREMTLSSENRWLVVDVAVIALNIIAIGLLVEKLL